MENKEQKQYYVTVNGTGTLHKRLFKVSVCVGEKAKSRGAVVFGDVCRTGDRIARAV